MANRSFKMGTLAISVLALMGLITIPALLRGHCDTLGGPVVKDGRAALETGKIAPALKWVKTQHEAELRQVFDRTLAVRTQGPDAAELADRHFLETLVRLHRAGEGASYAGLKDAPAEPIVALADKALATGSARAMLKALEDHFAAVLAEKFQRVLTASKARDTSVEAGREYVEAYVAYTHYLEALHTAIVGSGPDHH